jgi:hypothetical protein
MFHLSREEKGAKTQSWGIWERTSRHRKGQVQRPWGKSVLLYWRQRDEARMAEESEPGVKVLRTTAARSRWVLGHLPWPAWVCYVSLTKSNGE